MPETLQELCDELRTGGMILREDAANMIDQLTIGGIMRGLIEAGYADAIGGVMTEHFAKLQLETLRDRVRRGDIEAGG